MACNINTMYNARNYFKSAQNRPLNTNGKPNAQAVDDYTKTIKKCGIIISERKKGAQLDEAVFLMAKALYFKGNSAFQAKDQFQNLLLGFPNSPYVPEAHLYIAKILREINQPKDAEGSLDEFIRTPRFRKDHPKALLLLTDFAIQDKDYTRAQYWLERIIRDYPKTKEYRTAYFLFGKNYYEQKDYTASLGAFEKMQGSRRIDKVLKLDTRYYIGLNELELGMLERAYKTTSSLLRNETRPEKIPPIRLLKARILFAQGKNDDAKQEIEDINKTYPRTESSAAAFYYLADYQYYKAGDPSSAVTNYTRVRTEFTASTYATDSQNKSNAVTKVLPRANLNSEVDLKTFLDYHYQAAESFLSYLALPDSAIVCYRKVIAEKDIIASHRDSLQVLADEVSVTLDSLRTASLVPQSAPEEEEKELLDEDSIIDSLETLSDSLSIAPIEVETHSTAIPDTLETTELAQIETDYEEAAVDSVHIAIPEIVTGTADAPFQETIDSLSVDITPTEDDSLMTVQSETPEEESSKEDIPEIVETIEPEEPEPVIDPAIAKQIREKETQLVTLNKQISKLDDIIQQFATEIEPFCLFAIGSVLNDNYPESPKNAETLAILQTNYSNNKFTKALKALQQGLPVRLIDPIEESQEARLDSLFGMISVQPDSAVVGLEEMRQSPYQRFKLAATFRLGWYYSFEAPDTTVAKDYLNEVLKDTNAGDYATLTRRFYDGRKFLVWDKVAVDSLAIADSLAISDSLAIADSLGLDIEQTAQPDSLQSPSADELEIPAIEPQLDIPDIEIPEPSPAIKEEDIPLE
ncbi:MAG: tetratricopeptide repeat protein [Candidatus Cloacimonetes bacterium]|nr:tetratricopeptide repeat protein [Candidatus Cloacimonadota bacterium]